MKMKDLDPTNLSMKLNPRWLMEAYYKRYSIIFYNVFQTPLPFYAIHVFNPFPNSRISPNHDK